MERNNTAQHRGSQRIKSLWAEMALTSHTGGLQSPSRTQSSVTFLMASQAGCAEILGPALTQPVAPICRLTTS